MLFIVPNTAVSQDLGDGGQFGITPIDKNSAKLQTIAFACYQNEFRALKQAVGEIEAMAAHYCERPLITKTKVKSITAEGSCGTTTI